MTTHDHPTLTGSQDEAQTGDAAPPPVSEDVEPTFRQEQDQSPTPPAPADPSSVAEVSAPTDQVPAVPAKHSDAAHESSTEDLLFGDEELAELRSRWAAVQAAFVDDPSECVQKADVLVSDLVDQLTTGFANARSRLEEQWARGEQASTEDLRVALMHYREFFERLLAA
ncbi:hypothetical protein MNAB215_4994 [Mycobacterium numidiamassiliense]|uniref:Uncharacterized protein n=1 Tax=Mycobacterium numidiamassiliense TaxID=1841861 RepID=A0A2U3PG68_9MYCO|nr:hypothetical protein [Mycobacterium numidiamassiliense]SPM42774.1 hypothetical protein MNAB215_4994 [Mycobacterium numidiamassiliense]